MIEKQVRKCMRCGKLNIVAADHRHRHQVIRMPCQHCVGIQKLRPTAGDRPEFHPNATA